MAFKPSGGGPNSGMSVDIEDWIRNDGKDPSTFVTTPRWVGSVRFTAGALRAEGLRVGWDPIPRAGSLPANDYHGEVWDLTRAKQSRLQEMAEWFVQIEGVSVR